MILRCLIYAAVTFDIHLHINLTDDQVIMAVAVAGMASMIDVVTGRY